MTGAASVGERLAAARSGKSQRVAAELLGIGPTTLSRYERGEVSPDVAFIEKAAELFGVDATWLAFGREVPKAEAAPEIERELLESVIVDVRAVIAEANLALAPDKEALLIAILYRHQVTEQSDETARRQLMRQLLRAV